MDEILTVRHLTRGQSLRKFSRSAALSLRLPIPGGQKGTEQSNLLVYARIDQGRWLADCPHCNGSEAVEPDTPLFYCLNSWCSRPTGNLYAPLRFPKERVAIERVLLDRPNPTTRNWRRGESLADLRAENAAHGVA